MAIIAAAPAVAGAATARTIVSPPMIFPIVDVFRGVLPFLGVYVLAILLLTAAPQIAPWLPGVAM